MLILINQMTQLMNIKIHHSTIKMKPVDVKPSTDIDFKKENNEDPKFKVCDHVTLSKYKNIFAKDYVPNWSEEVFVIKKVYCSIDICNKRNCWNIL